MTRAKPTTIDHFTVDWLDAVESWARRQPVPEQVDPEQYCAALVVLQFQHEGKPLFIGRVNADEEHSSYQKGEIVILEPEAHKPHTCVIEKPFPLPALRENFTRRQRNTTYKTVMGFFLYRVDILPDATYKGW